jgi:hypothetical protein
VAKKSPEHGRKQEIQRVPGFADDYIEAHKAEILPKGTLDPDELAGTPGKVRRFVLGGGPGRIRRRPHIDVIAADAYTALMNEVTWLRDRSREGKLDPSESAALAKAIDGLVKLSREMRELDRQERAEDLSDEEMDAELRRLAKELEE